MHSHGPHLNHQQSRLPGLRARAFGNPLRINSFVLLHTGTSPFTVVFITVHVLRSSTEWELMWMAQIVICPYKTINFHINLVHAFSGEGIKFRKSPKGQSSILAAGEVWDLKSELSKDTG
jgi:hypothetical protein